MKQAKWIKNDWTMKLIRSLYMQIKWSKNSHLYKQIINPTKDIDDDLVLNKNCSQIKQAIICTTSVRPTQRQHSPVETGKRETEREKERRFDVCQGWICVRSPETRPPSFITCYTGVGPGRPLNSGQTEFLSFLFISFTAVTMFCAFS